MISKFKQCNGWDMIWRWNENRIYLGLSILKNPMQKLTRTCVCIRLYIEVKLTCSDSVGNGKLRRQLWQSWRDYCGGGSRRVTEAHGAKGRAVVVHLLLLFLLLLLLLCLKRTTVVRCTSVKRKRKLWDVLYYYTRNIQCSRVVCGCTSKLTGSELGGTILNSASCKGEGCLTQVRQETEENWSRFWYCHTDINHMEVEIIMRGCFENLTRKYQALHMFSGKC